MDFEHWKEKLRKLCAGFDLTFREENGNFYAVSGNTEMHSHKGSTRVYIRSSERNRGVGTSFNRDDGYVSVNLQEV